MLSPALVGRLRRIGVWQFAQKVHRLIAPPICGGVHHAVKVLGPDVLPLDLILKHHYDYVPVEISPSTIVGFVPIHAGMPKPQGGLSGLSTRYRVWRNLGGGWKNTRRHITRNVAGRFIAYGDWDKSARPFTPVPSIHQIFVEGAKPEDTDEYQRHVSKVGKGELAWTRGFRSVDEVDDYFAYLIRIYEDISSRGYRTQLELGRDGADEIRVCIGRDGQVSIFGGGTHRLSMALILQIDRVPVLMKRVHPQWVADCVQRYGGTVESAISRGIEGLTRTVVEDKTEKGSASAESTPVPTVPRHAPKQIPC